MYLFHIWVDMTNPSNKQIGFVFNIYNPFDLFN